MRALLYASMSGPGDVSTLLLRVIEEVTEERTRAVVGGSMVVCVLARTASPPHLAAMRADRELLIEGLQG